MSSSVRATLPISSHNLVRLARSPLAAVDDAVRVWRVRPAIVSWQAAIRTMIVVVGIGGLAAANALQPVGIEATVFEKAPQIAEVGVQT